MNDYTEISREGLVDMLQESEELRDEQHDTIARLTAERDELLEQLSESQEFLKKVYNTGNRQGVLDVIDNNRAVIHRIAKAAQ